MPGQFRPVLFALLNILIELNGLCYPHCLAEGAIWIDETAGLAHSSLRSKARRLQAAHGIDVDYLQLMHALQPDGKRFQIREQEIAEISRSLKAVAKELNVPVLALARLRMTRMLCFSSIGKICTRKVKTRIPRTWQILSSRNSETALWERYSCASIPPGPVSLTSKPR